MRRFTHAEEGEVSTRLRQGDGTALDWYITQGRIQVHPDREGALAAAAAEVSEAQQAGSDALLITRTDEDRRAGAASVDLLTVDQATCATIRAGHGRRGPDDSNSRQRPAT